MDERLHDPLGDDLGDDLRDLLAIYRASVQPSAAGEVRIRESLQASVPDWSTPPKPADEGVLLSFASRGRQAVFVLCSAAAALALTIGLSSYLGEHRQRAQDDQQSLFQRRDAESGQGQARVRDAEPGRDQARARDASSTPPVVLAEPGGAPEQASTAATSASDEHLDEAPLGEASPSGDGRPADAPPESEGSTEDAAAAERGASRATPAAPRRAAKADSSPRPERGEDSHLSQAEEPSDGATEAPSLDLAEELRLIREAENHLRAGRDAQAIKVLNRHRRDFPAGQLEPEREASRVTALCQRGLEREAREQAQVFAERWPQSPLLPRVLRVCTTGTGL